MSDRAPGRTGRTRLVVRTLLLLGLLGVVAGPLAPLAAAADPLSVTTQFPGISVTPGSTPSFSVTIASGTAGEVKLSTTAPKEWNPRFHGGGATVTSAYVTADKPATVQFDLDIPADATASAKSFTIVGQQGGQTSTLALSVTVDTNAAGDVTLKSDFPELKGSSSTAFTFTLTAKNTTAEDITFSLDAKGPDGWTVNAKPQAAANATTINVPSGGTNTLSVSVTPPADATAGQYPVQAILTGGGRTVTTDMQITITGSYKLTASTPDGVLSTTANAGTEKTMTISVVNSGTSPITAVTPSASAPTGWKVTFDPETIDTIAPGDTATVTAKIVPSGDAITGDYEMTITVKNADASDDVAIRVRVETPTFWWIAGIALIAAVFAGLFWVFRTYGRR